jgi:hypothetical protein
MPLPVLPHRSEIGIAPQAHCKDPHGTGRIDCGRSTIPFYELLRKKDAKWLHEIHDLPYALPAGRM